MMLVWDKRGSTRGQGPWGRWLTLAVLLLIAAQSVYLLIQGASYCPTAGCTIVEGQSPVSPLVFNISGLVFFTLLLVLFLGLRRRDNGVTAAVLSSLLLAGMAAEAVFFFFQYQTGAFCLYCCMILAAIVLLNICLGRRQVLRAIFVFTAAFFASFLLTAPKGPGTAVPDIDTGILAHRTGQPGAEERYFFFAEECPHCKAALRVLIRDTHASLYLNPLTPLHQFDLPGFEVQTAFLPEANRAFLASIGIRTVPVLLVRQATGDMRILLGEEQVIDYVHGPVQKHGLNGVSQQSGSDGPPMDFLLQGSDGCSVSSGCSQ